MSRRIVALPDGAIIASENGFDSYQSVWRWIAKVISAKFNCSPDDIDFDTDERISVRGEVVAVIEREH